MSDKCLLTRTPYVGFKHTHFYYPYQFHEDTKRNENTIQNLPPKLITGFIEAYKYLMRCFIVFQFFLKLLKHAEYMISCVEIHTDDPQ
jgi:hypothetical protein